MPSSNSFNPLLLQSLMYFWKTNLEGVLIENTANTQGGYVDRQVKLNNTMSEPKSHPEDTTNQPNFHFSKIQIFAFND